MVITIGSRRFPTHIVTVRQPSRQPAARARPQPRLAIVVDDFGYSRNETVESFLALDLPLTVAVLPSLPRTEYVLSHARAAGKEAILHLPMQAETGPMEETTVATSMDDARIREIVERHLASTKGVVGVNNHQGSLATRDRRVMQAVIGVLKQRDLFFLDSLTSSESVAYNTARSFDVPTARNDLFLDDDTEDPAVVEARLRELVEVARARGQAIGIAHPKPWTLAAIAKSEGMLRESGVELVFVSQLMK